MTREQGQQLAEDTVVRLEGVPGLLYARFLGDFSTGTHFYLMGWHSKEAYDEYAQTERMLGVRSIAEPYVSGRPARRILEDYTPANK